MKKSIIACLLCLCAGFASAQTRWYNPMQAEGRVVEGQGWYEELSGSYNRLPDRIREKIRPSLWNLSTHSAGLSVLFRTDAPSITVRYSVSGEKDMEHMPATGVSGVDLYVMNETDGEWHFTARDIDWRFGDTIRYTFRYAGDDLHEYRLYLPLYNHVEWLEVGVDSTMQFEWVPCDDACPIVAYGTSILQGGCASRPGMAWTNVLSRRLQYPLMNLGFSGNGQMDPEIIDLIAEVPARLYIIDCIPNVPYMEDEQFVSRFRYGVTKLREASDAPILLVEHEGGMSQLGDPGVLHKNELLRNCYEALCREGVKDLYLFKCEEMDFPEDGTVDGVHPNDLGMEATAAGYEKKIREIFRDNRYFCPEQK